MDQWKDGICNSPHGGSIDKNGNLLISSGRFVYRLFDAAHAAHAG